MRITRLAATFGALAVALAAAACGGSDSGSGSSGSAASGIVGKAASQKKLTIGVKADQPGPRPADRQHLHRLRHRDRQDHREGARRRRERHHLEDHGLRQPRAVHPAGPGRPRGGHLHDQRRPQEGRQLRRAVLRRRAGPAGPGQLDDHRAGVAGRQEGLLGHRLDPGQADPDRLQARPSCSSSTRYSKCVTALAGGQVDAVTTDDIILAGYAARISTRASSRWSASRSAPSRTASA